MSRLFKIYPLKKFITLEILFAGIHDIVTETVHDTFLIKKGEPYVFMFSLYKLRLQIVHRFAKFKDLHTIEDCFMLFVPAQ
jgi:hypothetical protein